MNAKEIAELIDKGIIKSRDELVRVNKSVKYTEIMKYVKNDSSKELLKRKPTREMSGVSVIAVMCKPHKCPGNCSYCPKGDDAPQSYTGFEPAAMRAKRNNYDSYKQVIDRLKQYKATGHDTSKIEVIVMGGTFLSTPISYQEEFIKGIYRALNNTRTNDLEQLKKENEKAKHRCVGITFETRPDVCGKEEIINMLRYGGTRCELGCQSIYDEVLNKINRGHTNNDTINAIKRLKDYGFKVDLHVMIGLPGSTPEMDVNMFKELYSNPNYMPDGVKIYPTLVMKGTRLYDDWINGDYKPLTNNQAINIIARALELTPPWVRIKRVMRDIPTTIISAGPNKSNLRELAWRVMKKECDCIRCREVGRKRNAESAELFVRDYNASGGREFFISYEDPKTNALIGFARLRLGLKAWLRELHVYGRTTPIGDKGFNWQHKGYGTKLLRKAEELALISGYDKLIVISGVGVRGYYKSRGYYQDGYYVSKDLKQ